MPDFLQAPVKPDYESFLRTLRREGTPRRVHHIELFHDLEVHRAIGDRFGVGAGIDPNDPNRGHKYHIEWSRFMGYDYVSVHVGGEGLQLLQQNVADDSSKELAHTNGRRWADEHKGPIATWEDFEKYPWPNPHVHDTTVLEWYHENLPDDMTIIGGGPAGSFCEWLCWLFGYETLCFALLEERDLVMAVVAKLEEYFLEKIRVSLQFPRVTALWGADDLGFRTGLLLGPDATREFILPGHKKVVRAIHDGGRLYLLHCCGNLADIRDDLIDDVRIDGKHSFEDTIEDVCDAKRAYGDRLTLLGGIDVDFLCRSDEAAIRKRVRETAEVCLPGGGWCLGTGNSVANYIPLDNYLAMVDEGRKITG